MGAHLSGSGLEDEDEDHLALLRKIKSPNSRIINVVMALCILTENKPPKEMKRKESDFWKHAQKTVLSDPDLVHKLRDMDGVNKALLIEELYSDGINERIQPGPAEPQVLGDLSDWLLALLNHHQHMESVGSSAQEAALNECKAALEDLNENLKKNLEDANAELRLRVASMSRLASKE